MKNEDLNHKFPKEKKIDIKIKKKLTYILSPILGKSREIEVAHGRSIHLKDKKLLAPLLIAIRDVFNNVATRKLRHEEIFGILLVPLHKNKVTESPRPKERPSSIALTKNAMRCLRKFGRK